MFQVLNYIFQVCIYIIQVLNLSPGRALVNLRALWGRRHRGVPVASLAGTQRAALSSGGRWGWKMPIASVYAAVRFHVRGCLCLNEGASAFAGLCLRSAEQVEGECIKPSVTASLSVFFALPGIVSGESGVMADYPDGRDENPAAVACSGVD